MDRRRQAGNPGIVKQVAVFEVVIGMVMADQNILHRRYRHAGRDQLAAHAHAAIDHERRIVHHNEIGRIGGADADARPTLGTQENDSRARLCRRLRKRRRRGDRRGATKRELQHITAVDHGALSLKYLRHPSAASARRTSISAQHAVKRGQADDHGRSDQSVADGAKQPLAGAAEQGSAEPDADRVDRADQKR